MGKKIAIVISILVVTIIVLFSNVINLIFDYLWFSEIDYKNVFLTTLYSKFILGVIAGIISFIIIYFNLKIAHFVTRERKILNLKPNKHINKILPLISLIFSFFTAILMASNWETVLKFLNATSFNIIDPIFKKDISFYFFVLPFIKTIINLIWGILITSLIGTFTIYIIKGIFKIPQKISDYFSNFTIESTENNKEKRIAKIHLSIIIVILFLITTLKIYFIKIPELLYSKTGPFTGASYTDIHAALPLLKILIIIAGISAFLSLINIFRKKNHFIAAAFIIYFITSGIGFIYPSLMQKFIVIPNELSKETPYIENNIKATQKAWKIDQIEKKDLTAETSINIDDIKDNEITIKNVRLWDRDPLLDTFSQIQEIRTYYDFISIDDDRYNINGEYRQIMLSPRELNSANLPNRSFINEHFSFTHGYGLTLGPVNQVTDEGLPLLFVKDIPPTSDIKSLEIKRPEIYFGEMESSYVFVKTKTEEFNYPKGDENVFSKYEGEGGIKIDSIFKKALLALKFGSLKIFLSNDLTQESKVLYYRNILERVQKVLPYIQLDNDPYLVVTSEGNLKWIADGYTKSNLYPCSQVLNEVNYMRNSVKIVIDAYDGKMQFYIADSNDPLIQTYTKIFGNTFLPLEKIPSDLKAHLRYPQDIFEYQTELYKTYHMEQAQIFYNKEDMWEIPKLKKDGEEKDPLMRHLIMKLPGEEKEEFIFMVPFTPKQKDNMSAWMAARSDGDNYGKLVVYRFPKQKLVYGPTQIMNRINQDPEISRQISLWDQKGSGVIHGNLFVIPIKESILYVEPLYLRAEGGKIPELKRVIVVFENKIAMGATLDEALNQIFKEGEEKITTQEQPLSEEIKETTQDLIKQAKEYFEKAQQAQKDGNWSLYGEEIKKLGEVLEKLN